MPRRMPTTLRPRFRAQARGGSLLHHAPNRRPRFPRSTPPPGPSAHPSGFSIRSQQDSFGFNPTAHQRLPFVPPLPRSSIPESATMIPQTRPRRLSEIQPQRQWQVRAAQYFTTRQITTVPSSRRKDFSHEYVSLPVVAYSLTIIRSTNPGFALARFADPNIALIDSGILIPSVREKARRDCNASSFVNA